MGIVERIKEIEFEMARTQKNKATGFEGVMSSDETESDVILQHNHCRHRGIRRRWRGDSSSEYSESSRTEGSSSNTGDDSLSDEPFLHRMLKLYCAQHNFVMDSGPKLNKLGRPTTVL